MRVYFKKGYILIASKTITNLLGVFAGVGSKKVKGAAIPPFIFIKDERWISDALVRHELIHFRQTYEMLYIGLWIMGWVEKLYWIMKGYSAFEAYKMTSSEQEAYIHMWDKDYLRKRKLFGHFKYIFEKHSIVMGDKEKGEIIIDGVSHTQYPTVVES